MAAGAHADPGSVRGVGTEGLKGSDASARSSQDSRQRLIDAGVELVFEHYSAPMYSNPASGSAYYGGYDIGRFVYLKYQQRF